MSKNDKKYLKIVLDPIRVSAEYKPKFGQGSKGGGLSLKKFQSLYQSDPFYCWFGLDNPLMYTAHKAAGGMTSVYRQIGIGCESCSVPFCKTVLAFLWRTLAGRTKYTRLMVGLENYIWMGECPWTKSKTRLLAGDFVNG